MPAWLALLAACTPAPVVRVIAFNDFHGNLLSPGSFNNRPAGGVAMLAGYVKHLKASQPYPIVVSAGDLTGASPLVSAAFHDEPTIEVMNRLGLEFNAVGNHEFDDGKAELQRKQYGGCFPGEAAGTSTCLALTDAAATPFAGATFQYLAANVLLNDTNQPLFPPYAIKSFATPTGPLRVGFIGVTLQDMPGAVNPKGLAGLHFMDEAQTVNAHVPALRALGAETIVVLIHQGGSQGGDPPNDINHCSLQTGGAGDPSSLQPLRGIVQQLDDAVDLVISGHTHKAYACRLPNRVGRTIPVTQAGHYGRGITAIDLSIDPATGDVSTASVQNTVVDRNNPAIVEDEAIKSLVAAYQGQVAPIANRVVAVIEQPVSSADLPARPPATGTTGEKPAGDVIADAVLSATSASDAGGAQIAFTNAGDVRTAYADKSSQPRYPYRLTYGDLFAVQPFGNHLVTMSLTAQQIKDLLELQFPGAGCPLPSGYNRQTSVNLLQPSKGFVFHWQENAPACQKIRTVTLVANAGRAHPAATETLVDNGSVMQPTKLYRVTVNSFLADGGDGFFVFAEGKERLGGILDVEATAHYFQHYLPPNPGLRLDQANLPPPRIVKLP